jgi:hypothetical protein
VRSRTVSRLAWLLLIILLGANPRPASAQAELADPHGMTTVVVRFYAALERADMQTATSFIAPEQRKPSPLIAFEALSQLRLESLVPASRNTILAQYRYQSLLGKQCQGAALMTLRAEGDTWLIEKIGTSNRC